MLPNDSCPYQTLPLLFRILLLVPDLVFLMICNAVYFMLHNRPNRHEVASTNGEETEIGLYPLFSANSIFFSGTILVLVIGSCWRFDLMQLHSNY